MLETGPRVKADACENESGQSDSDARCLGGTQVEGGGIVEDPLAIRKPDPTTILQSVGPRVKNPRARHQYPEVVQSKEKLPPPIFPGVHGHGVVTSYLGADNQFRDTLGGSLSPLKNQDSSQNLGDSSLNNSRSRGFEAQPPGQKRCERSPTSVTSP